MKIFSTPRGIRSLIFLIILFTVSLVQAQNTVSIGTDELRPDAVLYLFSQGNQGLILPAVDNVNSFNPSTEGMIVYNRIDSKVYFHNGSSWVEVGGGSGGGGTTYGLAYANGQISLVEGGTTSEVTIALLGDVTGDADAVTVTAIRGRAIANMVPADQQVLAWNDANGQWEPTTISAATGDDWGSQVVQTDGTLTGTGVTGDLLSVANVDDADADPTNEIQTIIFNNSTNQLSITDPNSVDDQVVDLSSLAGGSSLTQGTGIEIVGGVISNTGDTDASDDITTTDITDTGSGIVISDAERAQLGQITINQSDIATNAAAIAAIPVGGDMLQATYDANSNNIVDDAESAQSLSGTITTAQVSDITNVGSGEIITGPERAQIVANTTAITADTDGDATNEIQTAAQVPVTAQNGITSTDTQSALEELQGEISAVPTLPATTDGQIIVSNGTTPTAATMSGDATIDNSGVLTIAADAVSGTEIAPAAVGSTEILDGSITSTDLATDAVTLAQIADGGAVNGQVIRYNGTNWALDLGSNKWTDGAAVPNNADGELDGTYYLDTTTGEVYFKSSGTYASVGNIAGADGVDGDKYATSADNSLTPGNTSAGQTIALILNDPNLAYTVGQSIIVASRGTAGRFFEATVDSYVDPTLNVTVTAGFGAGNRSDWDVNLTGAPGAAGQDAFIYIGYADDAVGTNFNTTAGTREFIGFVTSTTALTPVVGDFVSFTQFRDLTAANQDIANVLGQGNDTGGATITGLPAPVAASDVATKDYIDNLAASNNITGSFAGGFTIANDVISSGNIIDGDVISDDIQDGTIGTVDIASGGNDQILTTDGSGVVQWEPKSGLGGASDLNGLSDVTLTSPASGEFLKYNGADWVNESSIFPISETLNTSGPLFDLTHSGGGVTMQVENNSTIAGDYVLRVESTGNSIAGYFINDNGSATNQALYAHTRGSGPSLVALGLGTGSAATFVNQSSSVNTASVLDVDNQDEGSAARFVVSNGSNSQPAVTIDQQGSGLALDIVSGDVDMSGNAITNLVDPVDPQDAATRQFVLDNAGGASDLDGLSDVTVTSPADAQILVYDGATDNRFENVNVGGQLTMANDGSFTINNDVITGNNIVDGSVNDGDLGTGSVASDEIIDGSIVNNDISPSAAIDITKLAAPGGSDKGFLTTNGTSNAWVTTATANRVFGTDQSNTLSGRLVALSTGAAIDNVGVRAAGTASDANLVSEAAVREAIDAAGGSLQGAYDGGQSFDLDGTNDLSINNNGAANELFNLNNTGTLRLGDANTSIAGVNLQVSVDDPSTAPRLHIQNINNTGDASLRFWQGAGPVTAYAVGVDATDDFFKISQGNEVGTNDRFVIDNNGRVGIGTNSPTEILDVDGNINFVTTGEFRQGGSRIFAAGANTLSIGEGAGFNGTDNVYIGPSSGSSSDPSSFRNTFVGHNTGLVNTTGNGNTFLGTWAGGATTIGSTNTFVGSDAAFNNTTGSGNTFIGNDAGNDNNITGNNNTLLGANTDVASDGLFNATAIGHSAIVDADNTVRLGTDGTALEFNGELRPGGTGTAGTAGQVLQSNGPGVAPTWVAAGGSLWTDNSPDISYSTGNVGVTTLGQSFGLNPTSDSFTYEGDNVGNYSLGWYTDPNGPSGTAYISGFDGVRFFTASTVKMSISSGGNVGIGTEAPAATLDVQAANPTVIIKTSTSATAEDVNLDFRSDFVGLANANDITGRIVGAPDNTNGGRLIFSTSSTGGTLTEALRIDANADVFATNNIGLDINGLNDGTPVNGLRLGGTLTGEAIGSKRTAGGNQAGLDFYTNNINRLAITNSGNVGIGTTTPTSDLSIGARGQLIFLEGNNSTALTNNLSENNTYTEAGVASFLVMQDDGNIKLGNTNTTVGAANADASGETTDWLTVRPTGEIEIGNAISFRDDDASNTLFITNPTDISSDYTLTLPADAGANGEVLTTDGSGNLGWSAVGGAGWGLTGNAGTTAGTNFIGTTDDVDLVFKRNNGEAGRISETNSSYGISSLALNTTGNGNVAVGLQALGDNTSGSENVSIGSLALQSNTTGGQNTAIGTASLRFNIDGSRNVALGLNTLLASVNASENTAIGYGAMPATTSDGNTAVGYNTMATNTTGGLNTVIGYNADVSASNLSNATAIGAGAIVGQSNSVVLGNNANVGIGTSTPDRDLDIESSDPRIRVKSTQSTTGATTEIEFGRDNGGGSFVDLGSVGVPGSSDFLRVTAANALQFNVNSANRMQIDNAGNVGIGTSTPDYTLDVAGGRGVRIAPQLGGENFLTLVDADTDFPSWGINDNTNRDLAFYRYNSTGVFQGTSLLIENSTGNVGIGTSSPDQAKLVVSGGISNTVGAGFHAYMNSSAVVGVDVGSGTYSIYASDRIATTEINVYSDERIKHILGKSNSTEDLITISKIEVTDYQFVDKVSKGDKTLKKVIAQQVAEVYPQAVNTNATDIIPSIYQSAEIENGWIELDTDLQEGDRVKLIFDNSIEVLEVLEVSNSAFRVDSEKQEKVFVYGKEVDDFHSVDYEALSMLNISATQELLKRIDSQNNEIEALKAELNRVRNSDSNTEAQLSTMQSQIDKLTAILTAEASKGNDE